MTIEEARDKYSNYENGYISCYFCPLKDNCNRNLRGFSDCWEKIARYMSDMEDEKDDAVNHPSHYTQGGIECIDAMKSADGSHELAVYCKIAAFKYIWRCEHKNGSEDVKKAIWYLNKFLELKGETNEPV